VGDHVEEVSTTMKTLQWSTFAYLSLAVSAVGACGDDGEGADGADGSTGMEDSSTGSTTGQDTSASTTGTSTTSPTTTTDTDTDTTGGDPYVFDDSPPEDYDQVDRMGMPAVNTAVIMSKDAYNESTPTDDAEGTFVSEIVDSVTFLHSALDDDLADADLVPCMPDDCVAQGAPLVVPDTIKIDLTGDPGFPNGRLPADPVVDVTLAVLLLDLSFQGQDALTLAGLPLNPPANDVAFSDEFPFFAEPH
jgi:hypothetical protein